MAEKPFKVFVSHAAEDTWVAAQIAAHLERAGVATFLDEAHIAVGDEWEERVIVAAESSDEMVVLLTPEMLKLVSYVWAEVGMFRLMRKRVVWALYKVTDRQLAQNPKFGGIIRKADCVQLNDNDRYFAEVAKRVSATGG